MYCLKNAMEMQAKEDGGVGKKLALPQERAGESSGSGTCISYASTLLQETCHSQRHLRLLDTFSKKLAVMTGQGAECLETAFVQAENWESLSKKSVQLLLSDLSCKG